MQGLKPFIPVVCWLWFRRCAAVCVFACSLVLLVHMFGRYLACSAPTQVLRHQFCKVRLCVLLGRHVGTLLFSLRRVGMCALVFQKKVGGGAGGGVLHPHTSPTNAAGCDLHVLPAFYGAYPPPCSPLDYGRFSKGITVLCVLRSWKPSCLPWTLWRRATS